MTTENRLRLECVDLHPDVLSEEFSEDMFALDLGAFSQASAAGTKPLDSRFRGNDGLKKTIRLSFARNQDHVSRHPPVIPAEAGIQKSRSIIRHFAQPLMNKGLLPDRERITACRQTLKRRSRRIEKRLAMRAR